MNNTWESCKMRQPYMEGLYFVCDAEGNVGEACWCSPTGEEQMWVVSRDNNLLKVEPVAWMFLPEPYVEEDDDGECDFS